MTGSRHHVVSRGYLRPFADGELLRLFDKRTGLALPKPVGTRHAFVESGFNRYRTERGTSDELEDEWARVEREVLPWTRRLIDGDRSDDARVAARILASVHLVRSFAFREMHDRIVAESHDFEPGRIAAEPEVLRGWTAAYGREPRPGEIEAIVSHRIEDLRANKAFFVERMTDIYNKTQARFADFKTQIVTVRPSRSELITGDTPVFFTDGHKVGLRQGLAILDANLSTCP